MDSLGSHRASPFAQQGDALSAPLAPEALLHTWTSELKHVPSTDLRRCLAGWSAGTAAGWGAGARQDAYQELLLHGEFDVFCEVFETECRLQKDQLGDEGYCFQAALVLHMPADWAPDRQAMLAAFSRIRVDALTVTTPCGPGEKPQPIGEAVCHAMAALLRGGTTELTFAGSLALPEVVADAGAVSRLRSLRLQGWPEAAVVDEGDLEPQRMVLAGLASCCTLTQFHTGDARLLKMAPVLEKWALPGGPRLESVSVVVSHAKRDEIAGFVTGLAKFETLSTVVVSDPRPAWGGRALEIDMASAVLTPLSRHPGLRRLEIHSEAYKAITQANVNALFNVVTFAVSCPKLKHFLWTGPPLHAFNAGEAMHNFKMNGGDTDVLHLVNRMAALLRASPLQLEVLVMQGFPLLGALTQTLFIFLLGNRWLQTLNLDRCWLEVPSMKPLLEAILANPWLETVVVPMEHRHHWLSCTDGRIWGVESFGWQGLRLLCANADEAAHRLAASTFQPHWDGYKQLPAAIQRNRLIKETRVPLEGRIAAFMQVALQKAPVDARQVDVAAFGESARTVFSHLMKEQRLPAAVHLARVHAKIRGKDPMDLGLLRRLNSLRLTESAEHKELVQSVEAGDLERVAQLLSANASDVGGRAFQRARVLGEQGRVGPEMLEVFRAFSPSLSPPVAVTTTTTAATTLTTTTTAATQVSALASPSIPEGGQPPPQGA